MGTGASLGEYEVIVEYFEVNGVDIEWEKLVLESWGMDEEE